MNSSIIGWTFEADVHCVACAESRYPRLADGNIRLIDREGNECYPLFKWDDITDMSCGDCLDRLEDTL